MRAIEIAHSKFAPDSPKLLRLWKVVTVCHCRYCTDQANPCKCKYNAPRCPSISPRTKTCAWFTPTCTALVLARGLLARLQLVQVPAADVEVALVLGHAVIEGLDVTSARAGRLALRHGRLLVLLSEVGALGRGLGGCGRAAAEETANGVADGRADCDTAGGSSARVPVRGWRDGWRIRANLGSDAP